MESKKGEGGQERGRKIIRKKWKYRELKRQGIDERRSREREKQEGGLTTPSRPFQHIATQSRGRLLWCLSGHSALLSGKEYDPGPMQKAQGRLTQGQRGNYGALKSRYGRLWLLTPYSPLSRVPDNS